MSGSNSFEASSTHDRSPSPRAQPEPEVMPEGELQALASGSPRVGKLGQLQAMADGSDSSAGVSRYQRLANRGELHGLANEGTRGRGGPLPHLDSIQPSFGRHDLSGVQAHLDSSARDSARTMGAQAYAAGEHVVFAKSPSVFIAAHEAAHVIQQRSGVQLFGGVGKAGDVHERHADAVASAVVRGQSAEALLDRYADPSRARRPSPQLQPALQFWGEPDHYMMGQLGGVKAVKALDKARESLESVDHLPEGDYALSDEEQELDPSQSGMYEPDGKGVKWKGFVDKFMLHDEKGKMISYGGANRYAGDLATKAIKGSKRAPRLMGWPSKSPKDDYSHIMGWREKMLMATNANHFFPLARVEYLRQHTNARQTMALALATRQGGDEEGGLALARRALMYEGFAGHFLADCFAAGHLTPHALGRINSSLSKAGSGALVNTWHDIFNALPDGVPTTLGRFHGDYSMDGEDLEYVSSVICNSLLEIAMPWYAGVAYDGEILLPEPDVEAIMADPVIGPLWAQMCGDYHPHLERLKKLKSRKKKGLSKYAIYRSTADSQVTHEEVIEPIWSKIFGHGSEGDKGAPERIDDTDEDLAKIRGKTKLVAAGIRQILDYRGGWQPVSGRSQKFEQLDEMPEKYKFRIDMQSDNPLKKATPASAPVKAMVGELAYWLHAWREVGSISLTDKDTLVLDKLGGLLSLGTHRITGVHDHFLNKKRLNYIKIIDEALPGFSELEVTLPGPMPKVRQGPGSRQARSDAISKRYKELLSEHESVVSKSERNSLIAKDMKRFMTQRRDLFGGGLTTGGSVIRIDSSVGKILLSTLPKAYSVYTALKGVLNLVAMDPRPEMDDSHELLYGQLEATSESFAAHLRGDLSLQPRPILEMQKWADNLAVAAPRWRARGKESG
ncbi:hypothetical protein PPSIR1_41194, partial [Plesiocystis pacifica SIR-1]